MKTVLALVMFLFVTVQAQAAIIYCQTRDQKIRAEFIKSADGTAEIYIVNDDLNTKLQFTSSFYAVEHGTVYLEVAQLLNHGRVVLRYDDSDVPTLLYRIGYVNIDMDCDYGIKPGTMGH